MIDSLAEVQISDHQVRRITEEIGAEMARQRDLRTERFQAKTLPAAVAGIPSLAVVEIDGGRYQARDSAAGSGPGSHGVEWKEDKFACLVTMTGTTHDDDPHPDLPRCFLDKKGVAELVKGLTSQGSLKDLTDASDGPGTAESIARETTETAEPTPAWLPQPLVRTTVATTGDCDALGPMAAAEAQSRNFDRAPRKAFLGDGGAWIWRIQKTLFSKYTPIVDFIHVLSYVYLAAKAIATLPTEHWETYLKWARACWQGNVGMVITELTEWRDRLGPILNDEECPRTDPRRVIATSLGYLENNRSRMKYPEYRRAGLPTMSGLVESLIKQFNFRIKGTEKSWNRENAESVLQVCGAAVGGRAVQEAHGEPGVLPVAALYEDFRVCEGQEI